MLSRRLSLSCLALATLLSASACKDDPVALPAPAIDMGSAEPQDGPIPTGDPDSPTVPQIVQVEGPATAKLGQIVTLRITTNHDPIDQVVEAAIVLRGSDVWFKVAVKPEPAPEGAPGVWQIYLPAAITSDPSLAESELELEIALMNENGEAGAFALWSATLGSADDIVDCPADAACAERECGNDPLCATSCGSCAGGLACDFDGMCEVIGGACPDAAECTGLECGDDPVCGASCGTCADGLGCVAGSCLAGEGSCCEAQMGPGCEDLNVAACVCPF